MVGGRSYEPSYPNWQRKRIQNPSSVSSNLTEGTTLEQQEYAYPSCWERLDIPQLYRSSISSRLCGPGSCLTFQFRLVLYGAGTRFR
jgi:hypothetical protein